MGDATYPMTLPDILLATSSQATLQQGVIDFTSVVGKIYRDATIQVDGQIHHGCDELYGMGHCRDDYDDATRDRRDGIKKNLVACARLPTESLHGVCTMPLVAFRGPAGAAGHADVAPLANETANYKALTNSFGTPE